MFAPVNDLSSQEASVLSIRQYLARTDPLRPVLEEKDKAAARAVHDAYLFLQESVSAGRGPVEWRPLLQRLADLLDPNMDLFVHKDEHFASSRLIQLMMHLGAGEPPAEGPRIPKQYLFMVEGTVGPACALEAYSSGRFDTLAACEAACRAWTPPWPGLRGVTRRTLYSQTGVHARVKICDIDPL